MARTEDSRSLHLHLGFIALIGLANLHHLANGIPVSKYGKCHDLEKNLETREEVANAVFTGTVRELYPDYQHPNMWKGEVEIKRVFKGGNVILNAPHAHHKKRVVVDGLGDPHICHSMAREAWFAYILGEYQRSWGTSTELVPCQNYPQQPGTSRICCQR